MFWCNAGQHGSLREKTVVVPLLITNNFPLKIFEKCWTFTSLACNFFSESRVIVEFRPNVSVKYNFRKTSYQAAPNPRCYSQTGFSKVSVHRPKNEWTNHPHVSFLRVSSQSPNTDKMISYIRRATRGRIWGICPSKCSKHCIAILTFMETFKE